MKSEVDWLYLYTKTLRENQELKKQVRVLEELAPGRFRLGIGPSHRDSMQRLIGTDFIAPLGHLREYIQILKLN